MAIYSGGGSISDGIDGTFPDVSVETLKIGVPFEESSTMQGTVSGFASGGQSPSYQSSIEKFPFAISGGTATDVGDLSFARSQPMGNSSRTDGFSSGGNNPGLAGNPFSQIDKFPFSISGGTATDVGDLSDKNYNAGSSSSLDNAFIQGGGIGDPIVSGSKIDKFPFAISAGTATDVGDLTTNCTETGGHASLTDGFNSGGFAGSFPLLTKIDKFPFAISGGTATDVGDLNINKSGGASISSTTNGFNAGGASSGTPIFYNVLDIHKFPFAITSGTSTNVGSLSPPNNKYKVADQTSTTDGFTSGEASPAPTHTKIDKFPFAISGGTATNVGNLSADKFNSTGHQD
jgi:hypothetical protein